MSINGQPVNPYLPSWEYVPDGEPYVFEGRVYVYGSHDIFGCEVYCPGDYVCWSAPENDLGDWRYEGVIYRKDQDPANADLQGNLYAPDVTVGPDGRYYLYYVLSNRGTVSVAVCDTPSGAFSYYGSVRYPDGTLLGEAPGDEQSFDPGVLTEGKRTWLYTGFSPANDGNRHGSWVVGLEPDMLTVETVPTLVAPGGAYSKGTGFEGHAFFEASSIRKRDGKYYFIYSSEKFHELCYAVSDRPDGGFVYHGVLISSCDEGIGTNKPADRPMYYTANNHGSMVEIAGEWYVFYHRHTNGTNYARQGCFEKLDFLPDGTAVQPEMTSCCGCAPLCAEGTYPAYIACHLFTADEQTYVPWSGWMDDRFPKITQREVGSGKPQAYIANMRDGATAGFKYFSVARNTRLSVRTYGYAKGVLELRTHPDQAPLCSIPVSYANVPAESPLSDVLPEGIHALYFTFRGEGHLQFVSFTFRKG